MSPGIGEVNAAIGLHHNVVGTVELPSLKAVGYHRHAAIRLSARYSTAVMLTGNQSALQVPGQAVGPVGRSVGHRHSSLTRPLHSTVIVNVAEQQIAPFPPPQRTLCRPLLTPKSLAQLLDFLIDRYNPLQFRSHLFNGHKTSLHSLETTGAL